MTSLTQIAQHKKQQTRAAFIDAAWAEEPLERLADLAREAGIEPSAADAIIARITEARGHLKPTVEIPRLRRAEAKAKADAEATRARVDAAIEKLEDEADAASSEANSLRRQLNAAESASMRLLALHDEGLFPASRLPKEVLALVERREQERVAAEAHAALVAAMNERARLRGVVERLQLEQKTVLASREHPRAMQTAIERAKADLASAEARCDDAEKGLVKARKGL